MKERQSSAAIFPPRFFSSSAAARWTLPISACLGAVFGTVFGFSSVGFSTESVLSLAGENAAEASNYFWLLWCYSWPCMLSVFLSATLFGFALLPFLFAFRGFLLSFGEAALLRGGFSYGAACLTVGLPALFSFTALLLIGEESFLSSLGIYRTCLGYPRIRFSFVSVDRLLFAALLLSAAALVRQFLIPLLL